MAVVLASVTACPESTLDGISGETLDIMRGNFTDFAGRGEIQ